MEVASVPRRSLFGTFADVPPRVRSLILLMFPSLTGLGYFIIVISGYLPELGISATYVGLILGVFSVATILSSIPLGIMADRRGKKRIILVALSGIPFMFLVYGLTTDVAAILVISVFGGIIEAGFLTGWNALIADMTTLEQRNSAFSLSFVVNNISFGIGCVIPFLFPAIEDLSGLSVRTLHSATFLFFAAVSTISPIMIMRLLKDLKETTRERQSIRKTESLGLVLKFSVIAGVFGFGAGLIIPLIPTLLFLEFAVPDTYSGPLLAIASVMMALSAVASTRLAKRYGPVNTIVLTQASSTVFMLALAFSPNAFTLGGLYLIRTALMNMAAPVQDSYLMSVISEKDRGVASAITGITWRLPNSVTTVIGGIMLAHGMFDTPFFIATAIYIAGIVLFYHFFRNVAPKK